MNKIVNKLKGMNKLALAAGLLLLVALGVVISYGPLRTAVANILPFSTDPAVTITPNSGPLSGGTFVTITGEDFNGTTRAYFDVNDNGQVDEGEECTWTVHLSSTEFTCYTPVSETVGWKDLRITGRTIPGAMQGNNQEFCQALAIFDGNNPGAIATIPDSRNDVEYKVGRLADGNCWMLDNLKLGSPDDVTLLTPANSNVASDTFLPAITAAASTTYTEPVIYGPVPGDTGEGDTNYGYLYNWCAAMGVQTGTRACIQANNSTTHSANISICPSGWKMPTNTEISQLLSLGLNGSTFLAQFSGIVNSSGNHESRGSVAAYWTASNYNTTSTSYSAYFLSISTNSTISNYGQKQLGRAVRCVAI